MFGRIGNHLRKRERIFAGRGEIGREGKLLEEGEMRGDQSTLAPESLMIFAKLADSLLM